MVLPVFENDRGYDPYNHAGRMWLRAACWAQMRAQMIEGRLCFTPRYVGIDWAAPGSDRTEYFQWAGPVAPSK